MTLLEEAIERMLEAERDVCRLVSTNFNRHPQARDEYNAAIERRERFKTAIVEAYGQIEAKCLNLASLTPPAPVVLQRPEGWRSGDI